MRTARLTRPFWALGRRAPVLLAFPAGAAMEDLAPCSLPALGPEGLATASPAPQQQSQPRLHPRGWPTGNQSSPWHEARVVVAGPRGWGHPGSKRGQQPAWLELPMAPWRGPCCQGAVLCPPASPAAAALGTSAPPAGPSFYQVPTPHPATLGSPAPPVPSQRPPPPQPARAPAVALPQPEPLPLRQQPGLSPQINGLPDTPAQPVQC